jgi:signal peptidase I
MLKKNFLLILLSLTLAILLRLYVFEIRIVNGPSMEPLLMENDIVFIEKISTYLAKSKKDDIIAVKSDYGYMIKRIFAVAGDIIEFKNNIIYINGNKILDNVFNIKDDIIKVPLDYYFIMGDNFNMSMDSRIFGPICKNEIIGRYLFKIK